MAKDIDAENASRTSRYDQDLKERARNISINPDNFHSEEVLREAVDQEELRIKKELEQA